MFVAFHGSWNREEPTGYKVVFVPLSAGVADSATGPGVRRNRLAAGDGSLWGRVVDVLTGRDGSLLISDDFGGRIYRVFCASEALREVTSARIPQHELEPSRLGDAVSGAAGGGIIGQGFV